MQRRRRFPRRGCLCVELQGANPSVVGIHFCLRTPKLIHSRWLQRRQPPTHHTSTRTATPVRHAHASCTRQAPGVSDACTHAEEHWPGASHCLLRSSPCNAHLMKAQGSPELQVQDGVAGLDRGRGPALLGFLNQLYVAAEAEELPLAQVHDGLALRSSS